MASSCCGTKKQKLNNSQPVTTNGFAMNGHGHTNGYGASSRNGHEPNGYAEHNGHSSAPLTNGHSSAPLTNGHSHLNGHTPHQNGMVLPMKNGLVSNHYVDRIACPEMCFFCYDVLYGNLHNLEPPKAPNFTNDAL